MEIVTTPPDYQREKKEILMRYRGKLPAPSGTPEPDEEAFLRMVIEKEREQFYELRTTAVALVVLALVMLVVIVMLQTIGAVVLFLLLFLFATGCFWEKSKHRQNIRILMR